MKEEKESRIRIGVISDTHRNRASIRRALNALGGIDCLMHLGDGVKDVLFVETMYDIPVYAVSGNCDFGDYPTDLTIELGGRTIFLTHGHYFGVRSFGTRPLIKNAVKNGYDITLYGHTHVPELFAHGRHVFMNPGSTSEPRGPQRHPTCGLIELRDKEIFPSLIRLDARLPS